MDFTPINLALSSLKRQKARAILTMLAVSIGIMAVITIMAAGKGMQKFVLGQLEVFGADTLHIEIKVPNGKATPDFGSVGITVTTMKDRDLESVLKHPNVAYAYGTATGQEAISYEGQIKKILLLGQGYSTPDVEKIILSAGRFFSKDEEDSLAAVAVLGSKAKDKLFGDEDPIDKIIYIRGKPYRVVGSLSPRGSAFFIDMDNIIYLPTKTMQKKLLGIDYFPSGIMVKMKDGAKSQATAEELAEIIRVNHSITDPARDDFIVQTTAQAMQMLTAVTNGITMLLVALVCISLIVGGVGIMNIMYVSVAERTFEIGLRKSLGAKKKDILLQFLGEAVIITLGGGAVGIIFGAILSLLIYFLASAYGLKWVYSVSLTSVLLSLGFSAIIGLIFGIYPARRASALNPIDALRKE